MGEITIGIDIAKHVFQLHGVDATGKVVVCRRLRRAQVATFFAALPPCLVGMEACATAHFWAREIAAFGHDVRLMPPGYVKPYVKRNKHDAPDAEAVCEAARRPSMRFLPIKTPASQAVLVVHSVRDLLVRQRTMLVNAVRGHLAEFGIVASRGLNKVKDLVAVIPDENEGRLQEARRIYVHRPTWFGTDYHGEAIRAACLRMDWTHRPRPAPFRYPFATTDKGNPDLLAHR